MLSVDEVEKKSKAIIEEYLHLNDMKVGTGEGLVIACKGWGRGGMLTGMVYIGWGPGNDGFLLHMYCLRRQYSVSRSLASPSLLFIFIWLSIKSTLEHSTIACEHKGQLQY